MLEMKELFGKVHHLKPFRGGWSSSPFCHSWRSVPSRPLHSPGRNREDRGPDEGTPGCSASGNLPHTSPAELGWTLVTCPLRGTLCTCWRGGGPARTGGRLNLTSRNAWLWGGRRGHTRRRRRRRRGGIPGEAFPCRRLSRIPKEWGCWC